MSASSINPLGGYREGSVLWVEESVIEAESRLYKEPFVLV
jgi:hypothetical protein